MATRWWGRGRRSQAAPATYDGHIHNAASAGAPLEMVDAGALLGGRLALRETSVYSLLRWAEVLRTRGDVAGAATAAAASPLPDAMRAMSRDDQ